MSTEISSSRETNKKNVVENTYGRTDVDESNVTIRVIVPELPETDATIQTYLTESAHRKKCCRSFASGRVENHLRVSSFF